MKIGWRSALVCVAVLLLALCLYRMPSRAISLAQKGISYAAFWSGEYAKPESAQSLAALRATGADWIALIVTQYQDSLSATTIHATEATPSDAELVQAITQAHALGLKVMLKPHVDIAGSSEWRGAIGSAFTSEAQWTAWFTSYRRFISHYAELAARYGVEQFCLGTELVGTTQRAADWRAVVAAVRVRYDGPLTYAANWGGEEVSLAWWDALDTIGVDAYYPLTDKNDPTLDELKAAWAPHAATLSQLAAQWGKGILLTEIGYRSQDGANRHPWDWVSGGAVDLAEQADCYRAALESLWGQPWLAGLYWWAWGPDPYEGGPCDADYTPHDKPAEDVLREFYGAPPRPQPTPAPEPDARHELAIYQDALPEGWADWSWGAQVDSAARDQVYSGTQAISLTLEAWGALSLHADAPVDPAGLVYLEFAVRAASPGAQLWVYFQDEQDQPLRRRRLDDCRFLPGGLVAVGEWQHVRLPLSDLLEVGQTFSRLTMQERNGERTRLWLDEIRLLGARWPTHLPLALR